MRQLAKVSRPGWLPPDNVKYAKLPRGVGVGVGGVWFAKLAIDIDGKVEAFAAWNKNKERAIREVESYLDQRCQCKKGGHPLCEVHGTTNG